MKTVEQGASHHDRRGCGAGSGQAWGRIVRRLCDQQRSEPRHVDTFWGMGEQSVDMEVAERLAKFSEATGAET